MKPLKPLKEKISITIDADILEKIKYEAECDDRSLSQYINLVLKNHINSKIFSPYMDFQLQSAILKSPIFFLSILHHPKVRMHIR